MGNAPSAVVGRPPPPLRPGATVVVQTAAGPVTATVREDRGPFPPGSPVEAVWDSLHAEGFRYRSDQMMTALRPVWPEEHMRHEPARQHANGRIARSWYYRSPVDDLDLDDVLHAIELHALAAQPPVSNRAAARALLAGPTDEIRARLSSPVDLRIDCAGTRHVLRWDGATRLIAVSHPPSDADELAMAVLGADTAGCIAALHRWSSGRVMSGVAGFYAALRLAQRAAGYRD